LSLLLHDSFSRFRRSALGSRGYAGTGNVMRQKWRNKLRHFCRLLIVRGKPDLSGETKIRESSFLRKLIPLLLITATSLFGCKDVKCIDEHGNVTLKNFSCPKGTAYQSKSTCDDKWVAALKKCDAAYNGKCQFVGPKFAPSCEPETEIGMSIKLMD